MGELRDAQAAREEHLDDGAVAVALVDREVDACLEHVHLLSGEVFGQVLGQVGRLEQLGGVYLQVAVKLQVTVERAHAAEDARLRLGAQSVLVERGGKVFQVFEFHVQRVEVVVVEIVQQPPQVVAVGLDGVGRYVALQLEIAQVAACNICGLAVVGLHFISYFCMQI